LLVQAVTSFHTYLQSVQWLEMGQQFSSVSAVSLSSPSTDYFLYIYIYLYTYTYISLSIYTHTHILSLPRGNWTRQQCLTMPSLCRGAITDRGSLALDAGQRLGPEFLL